MPRFSVTLDDSVLNQVDSNARKRRLSRSDYVAAAIESSLHQTGSELVQCESKLNQCESELNQIRQSMPELKAQLENQIAEKDKIIESIRGELNQQTFKLNQAQTKLARIESAENQLAEKNKTIESITKELNQCESELNQRESELTQAKIDMAKNESALRAKEDEVSFLRGHVAQLTQSVSQFALKPGDEEIKKKGWWQFWRKA